MAIVSMRSKKRIIEIVLAASLCSFSLLIQLLVLNQFSIQGITCSLPLTLLIVWGLVFGSPLPSITLSELRSKSFRGIFLRQILSGSISGLLIGFFFTCLYGSIIPVYPLAFSIIGWAAGYFCLRGLSPSNLLCIPATFILSIIAEALFSWQLSLGQRAGVFEHLSGFILPEALLNSIIAPFIYFPLRRWYDLSEGQQEPLAADWGD